MSFYHYPTEGKKLTCMDVQLHTVATSYTWELGHCYGTQKYTLSTNIYIEKCCVANGYHLLSCENNLNSGWSDSFLKIGEHTFCDDIIGKKKFILVNVPGRYSFIHTYSCIFM